MNEATTSSSIFPSWKKGITPYNIFFLLELQRILKQLDDDKSVDDINMINNNNQRNSSYHRHSLTSSQQRMIDNNINTDPTCCNIDRIIWVRSVFVVSGITFMLFSWLFVVLGLTNAQATGEFTFCNVSYFIYIV